MTEEKYNQNQTQFAAEQALRQAPPAPASVDPPAVPLTPASPPKPKLPRWARWVIGSLGFVIVVLVVAVLTRPSQEAPTALDVTPVEIERPLTPMELRLEAAKTLLKNADPTTQGLPFPPVDMLLRIDKTR